jgi:AcrR family transcriptional regulator
MAKDMRAAILTEALIELNNYGADFHMDDLARRLQISKRTLYQHFSSKQEIVKAAVMSVMTDIYEKHLIMMKDESLTIEEKIMKFFTIRSRYDKAIGVCSVRRMNDVFMKMPEVWRDSEIYYKRDWAILDQCLDEAQKSELFENFDKPLLMHMLHSAAEDVLEYLNDVGQDYSFPDYMTKCLSIILYGIKNRRHVTNDTKI